VTDPNEYEGEFETWPLHDAVLGPLTLDWETRTCRLELAVFFHRGESAQPAVIEWRGVSALRVSRDDPWGPSVYVNGQRREGERSYVIEVQSGDEIRVTADSATLHEHRAAEPAAVGRRRA
jgi:hypothetical protein